MGDHRLTTRVAEFQDTGHLLGAARTHQDVGIHTAVKQRLAALAHGGALEHPLLADEGPEIRLETGLRHAAAKVAPRTRCRQNGSGPEAS